jgi:hypothetical protein
MRSIAVAAADVRDGRRPQRAQFFHDRDDPPIL